MKMLVGNRSLLGTAIVMETSTGKIKAIANLGRGKDSTFSEDLNYGARFNIQAGNNDGFARRRLCRHQHHRGL